jgi:hypothetical protein
MYVSSVDDGPGSDASTRESNARIDEIAGVENLTRGLPICLKSHPYGLAISLSSPSTP